MKKTNPIRVIIADTSFIFRKGLRLLVDEQAQFEYVAQISETKELWPVLSGHEADVLIIEHGFKSCFSTETIEKVRNDYPALGILVISHEKSADEIRRIINLGIKNYLLKDCDEQEITDAISACNRGDKYFCGQIIDVLLEKEINTQEHCMTGSISEREGEVIRQLASGKRPKEIALIMNLSYHTIVTHKRNIYSKLGINNTVELAMYAARTGLTQ